MERAATPVLKALQAPSDGWFPHSPRTVPFRAGVAPGAATGGMSRNTSATPPSRRPGVPPAATEGAHPLMAVWRATRGIARFARVAAGVGWRR